MRRRTIKGIYFSERTMALAALDDKLSLLGYNTLGRYNSVETIGTVIYE
jgi:hypothetical protein